MDLHASQFMSVTSIYPCILAVCQSPISFNLIFLYCFSFLTDLIVCEFLISAPNYDAPQDFWITQLISKTLYTPTNT